MKKEKTLFNANITPACEYCVFAKDADEPKMVMCERAGMVSTYYRCKKFKYSPVRRIPNRMPKLPNMNPDDFKL